MLLTFFSIFSLLVIIAAYRRTVCALVGRSKFVVSTIVFIIVWIITGILFIICFISIVTILDTDSDIPGKFRGYFSFDRAELNRDLKDAKFEVQELETGKRLLLFEMNKQEKTYHELHQEVSTLTEKKHLLQKEKNTLLIQLSNLQKHYAANLKENQLNQYKMPSYIRAPLNVLIPQIKNPTSQGIDKFDIVCDMESCFDYTKCSVVKGLPIFVIPVLKYIPDNLADLKVSIESMGVSVSDSALSCLNIIVIDFTKLSEAGDELLSYLSTFESWKNTSQNHVIIGVNIPSGYYLPSVAQLKESIFVTTEVSAIVHRPGFDIVSPYTAGYTNYTLPYMLPVQRTFLTSFCGMLSSNNMSSPLITELLAIQKESNSCNTSVRYEFQSKTDSLNCAKDDWCICSNKTELQNTLERSTFSLIISPLNRSILFTQTMLRRLTLAVSTGAIPVIVGTHIALPYAEFLDWSKCAIRIPQQRLPELHFILSSLADSDVFNLRLKCREIYGGYFATPFKQVKSIMALLRSRLGIPPGPISDSLADTYYNETRQPKMMAAETFPNVVDFLGPLEPPVSSQTFLRNFTAVHSEQGSHWDQLHLGPFNLYPFTPFSPVLPTDYKYFNNRSQYRPINEGEGGNGSKFSEALGGNHPKEQFTIVILVYDRILVLINALEKLVGLPYLNAVIIVWNSQTLDPDELRWPSIGYPFHIVRVKKNSLNNRFIPYDLIKTEAILSLDDDVSLHHEEIVFGFRVWRENRHRLVGFPGRYHAWDRRSSSWYYNANRTCEMSIILTGATFYHKYYNYLYWHYQDPAIIAKVDELMNCEDIAMNMLVSHVSKAPPLKVSERWTLPCPGCDDALSNDENHYHERNRCMKQFAQIYGYMPLMYTQYRADSLLYKSRMSQKHVRCFKYV